jgi:membrane protein YdbS with pleckstrin-like domain
MKGKIIAIVWGIAFVLAVAAFVGGGSLGSYVQGAGFLFACALAFAGIVLRWRRHWWAVIPAGLFASLGLIVLLDNLLPYPALPEPQNMLVWGPYMWFLFLGLAATFGVLWLMRGSQPTGWAIYPAAGLLVLAIATLVMGRATFQEVWLETIAIVTAGTIGLALLVRLLRPSDQPPTGIKA